LKSKVISIFKILLGNNTPIKNVIKIKEKNGEQDATIKYTFFYNNKQIESERIYVDENVVNDNGDLELDADDIIETIVIILSIETKNIFDGLEPGWSNEETPKY